MSSATAVRIAPRAADDALAPEQRSHGAAPDDAALAEALIEHAPYAICLKDLAGRYLLANRAFHEVVGGDGAPLVGRTVSEVFGADRGRMHLEQDIAALAAGGPTMHENTCWTGGESITYCAARFPVHDAHGALAGVGTILTDITGQVRREAALRESETWFREMADTVPALIWTSDPTGNCSFVNRQWLQFTGRRLEQELGRGFAESIHPADHAHSVRVEAENFAHRKAFSLEYRLRRADGEYRIFLDTVAPRFAPDGTFVGHIGTLVDITERRQLEEALARTQRLEAVGRMTGGVAHDFNNLLTVMLGNVEVMLDMLGADSPLAPMAQTALAAASRGAELTRRLLAFARHQELEPKAVDIAALIEQTRLLLQRTLGEDIGIETRAIAGLWPATVDGAELEHALLNLAINARDAMPRGGTLSITAGNLSLDASAIAAMGLVCLPGDYVALSVVDTGTGMTAETLRRAVEPFYTTKEVGQGSGLGLSMVYGFCKQSGGDLRIDSTAGRGTSVTLFLPRAEGASPRGDTGPQSAPKALPGGPETILVVEDNAEVRAYVVGCLAGLGYDVLAAEDGHAALRQLEARPDVALMFSDIVMPGGLNGWELAAAARARFPGLKLLLTSGYAPDHEARPAGTAELPILAKPYPRQALAGRVREILDGEAPGGAPGGASGGNG